MDHSLEAHVDLAATNDLRHIGRIIRLQDSDIDAFLLEITLGLGKVKRRVIRRRVP